MCGIAGIFNINNTQAIEIACLKNMISSFRHRGPDECGIYLDDRVGLAHSRLSIIDLSGGTQPIHNEDQSLWIIYNGETYNYPELRDWLTQKGHHFYTNSDTEVILHLYEEKKEACLNELNGQFAIAIWDTKNKELFIARDRLGIRPLYYTNHNNQFFFASEIKAILTGSQIQPEFDYHTLDQIFTFWTPLPGKTIFKGIQELKPGHYLKICNDSVKIQPYWRLSFADSREYQNNDFENFASSITDLFLDAVRIRLRADVPVGSYLSGGLDSSGVTATIKNNFQNKLTTFGMRFSESSFDEGEFQKQMVAHLGVEHNEIQVNNSDIGQSFSNVLWHCEQPLLRTSPVPLYLLSSLVSNNSYKVVLTGEGADEIFGGYNIFKEAKIRQFWAKQPQSQTRPLLLGRLYPYIFKNPRINVTLNSFFGKGLDTPEDPFFSHLIRWHNTSKIKLFLSDGIKNDLAGYNCMEALRDHLPERFAEWDYLAKAQYLEIALFLSNYLLSCQGDRVAMAHSIEIRLPYLDYRLVELMSKAPPQWKINGLNEKYLLKRIFNGVLPESIRTRDKHPYRAPIKKSLFNKSLPYFNELLSENALIELGIFHVDKVKRLLNKFDKYDSVSEVDNMALTGILSTQILWQRFIKEFPNKFTQPSKIDLIIDRRKNKN